MKYIIFFFLVLITSFTSFSIDTDIIITESILGKSISNQAIICEDKDDTIGIDDLLNNDYDSGNFKFLTHEVGNMDFTSSTFWIKFHLTNQTNFYDFILETARPITNIVELYEVNNGEIKHFYSNGDGYTYDSKEIRHRKVLFPIHLLTNGESDIYIKLKSDGEVLTLPLIIHEKDTFFRTDSNTQFFNGIYYGILILIVVIYFFFYVFLNDKTFLYYISYVAAIFLLQFSLDGYSFQYFFGNNIYLANHFVLFIAAITLFLLLQYARVYLTLEEKLPSFNRAFKAFQFIIIVLGFLSFVPGTIYELMYPLINGVSLIGILLILYTIYYFRRKGVVICNYFTAAFTVFIIGAVIFILGNFNVIFDPIISLSALKLSSGLEVIILSISMATKYRDMQHAKEAVQAEALENLEEKNKLMDTMNSQLEAQVEERTTELTNQKEELLEKNSEIISSIKYALRIQEAILPSKIHIKSIIPNSFIFYKPKDVVSGDFYFVEKTITASGNKLSLFGAVDCTGHGVPGAFMSIVGNSYLRQSIHEAQVNSTGEALEFLNNGVCNTLRQDFNESNVRDGMDIALCALDFENKLLYFSGAKNPVFIIRNEILPEIEVTKRNPVPNVDSTLFLNEIKGDKHPIGAYVGESLKPFTTHKIIVKKGDLIYVFSDGFADQFGGPNGKKYNSKHFKTFLLGISQLPLEEQYDLIEKEFTEWRGDLEQVDDLCIIGVKV